MNRIKTTHVTGGATIMINGLTEHEWELVNAIVEKIARLPLRPVWQKIPEFANIIDPGLFFHRCEQNDFIHGDTLAFWATNRVYSNISAFDLISNRPPEASKVIIL